MNEFKNKVVVVTGASRGIGQAACVEFARKGATIAGVARGDLAETEAAVREAGGQFLGFQSDLSPGTRAVAGELVSDILGRTQRIDVLVNNAGVVRRAPAVDYSEADWEEVIRLNLSSPFFLSQAVAKWWLTGGREQSSPAARLKIVNVASILSFLGGVAIPAYTASKHGIAGVTKALASEWAPERINVNAVAPGFIATAFNTTLREDAQRNAAIRARIPEDRWGRPEEIAGGIVFLSSPEADYLNGSILNIDGGCLAR